MSLTFGYGESDDSLVEENENDFNVRDSLIFLIDATPGMFKNNSFVQCLEIYRNIVRQKCAHNRKDKMGLYLFGTKESNCKIDNIMSLQEFDSVTVDTLKNVHSLLKEGDDKYRELASDSKYPLYDALSYVFQQSHSVKTNIKTRSIILLCTCNDNPCSDDPDEKRRIEYLVATFKNSQLELRVVGLSDSWNDEIYYKDLQIISGTFTNEDYRRIYLEDFEQNIINPARSICKVPWKISSNISIEVSIMNLISTPIYPAKIKLEKEDNDILEAHRILREENTEDDQSQSVQETVKEKRILTNESIMYYKNFGGLNIYFKPHECKKIRNLGLDPCIEILAFKPIMCDPIFHTNSPYFVTYTTSDNESKDFFNSFICKCAEKKVMAVCKVVTKTTVLICNMIPSEDDGGFYMYKIPFNDNVRDLDDLLHDYIFSSEAECPKNSDAVYVLKKLMKHSKMDFDIKKFKNPKLEKCIAHIEALALDEKLGPLPPDSTLPPPIKEDVESLTSALIRLLNLSEQSSFSKKRSSKSEDGGDKKSKLDIKSIAENKKLNTLTVVILKEYLASVNQPTHGNKSNLIDRINKYLGI